MGPSLSPEHAITAFRARMALRSAWDVNDTQIAGETVGVVARDGPLAFAERVVERLQSAGVAALAAPHDQDRRIVADGVVPTVSQSILTGPAIGVWAICARVTRPRTARIYPAPAPPSDGHVAHRLRTEADVGDLGARRRSLLNALLRACHPPCGPLGP